MKKARSPIRAAAWLGSDLLLVVVGLDDPPTQETLELELEAPDGTQVLDARWLICAEDRESSTWLGSVVWPAESPPIESARLSVRAPRGATQVPAGAIGAALISPGRLADEWLAGLDPYSRDSVMPFLARALTEQGVAEDDQTLETLIDIGQSLREHLPVAAIAPGERGGLRADRIWRIDDRAFWVAGWIREAGFEMSKLSAISPEGARAELQDRAWWHPRPDVDKAYGAEVAAEESSPNRGFIAYCELDAPSRRTDGWVVQMTNAAGEGLEAPVRNFADDLGDLRGALLRPLREATIDDGTLESTVCPAIERFQRREADEVEAEEVIDFGEVPRAPKVSVVVALDRRLDLVQHQIAQFANDAAMREVELIYVAAQADAGSLREIGEGLHGLYRLPFRALLLSKTAGIPSALNAGAGVASGPLLTLLGRGVFPQRPGWLAPMVECHRATPNVGAVGAKLVHEDGSIQHAGLVPKPRTTPERTSWEIVSEFAGLSGRLPRVNELRRVRAVSATCLLLATERFWEHGGLAGRYLDGAYEDADLCLRLAAAGLENWYVPEAELYHLERWGQQPPPPAAARYNAWLFHRLWGDRLRTELGAGAGVQSVSRAALQTPRYPRTGVQRSGAPVEILDMHESDEAGDQPVKAGLERPKPGEELEPYERTYSFAVEGWARSADDEPVEVELSAPGQPLRRVAANLPRDDLDDAPAGFRAVVSALPLPREFEVSVEAVSQDGARSAIGTIRGRRESLRSGFETRLEPVLITTLGRTGSSWVALLLGSHPEVLAYQPFVFEPRTTSYWMTALQALAEPASYMQLIRPELYPGHWWLGDQLPIPLPAKLRDARMAQWLGRDGVEMLAGFCQSRIDDFYHEVARTEGKSRARYFTEKCWPDRAIPRLVSELYPGGRELILVRDLRDIVCSIFDFNAKRGIASFGRESVDTDEEFIRGLRDGALRMLESWRERSATAHLLRYEDLILEPESSLAEVFAYLGVDADPATVTRVMETAQETLPDAQRGHQTSGSVRGSVGRWREELSPELVAVCQESFGDVLTAFGYAEQDVSVSGVLPSAVAEAEDGEGDRSGESVR